MLKTQISVLLEPETNTNSWLL